MFSSPRARASDPAAINAAIETAHQRRAKVRAHIANKPTIIAALELDIDVVDHGDGLDQQCIDLLLEKLRGGVYVLIVTNSLRSIDGVLPHAGYIKYRHRLIRAGPR